jgi:glycosyltransferase involved in cell wall biosynthesis
VTLLWLNAGLLLPLDKGGKLRTWHLMRHLAPRHSITYLSFEDPSQTSADRAGMDEVCRRLFTIPRRDAAKGSWRFYADAARYLLDRAPYAVAKYRSAAYRRTLSDLLSASSFDAVVCDFLPPAINLPERLPCPSILFTHNVEAEIWRRHAETAANAASRVMLGRQWRRMLRFEAAALRRFDLVLAVSDADGQTFERLYPGALKAPVHVVQTGVDTDYFWPALAPGAARAAVPAAASGAAAAAALPAVPATAPSAAPPGRAHLVFTGSMDWLPNEDGMTYFCREILPRIRQAEPDATVAIIGRSPTPAVKKLGEIPGVEVTGRVDDVRPHIARGAVYIVPLRIGGGTRLKIFEAMAMGKAVVSTTVGAEGLPVTPTRDIVLADEPARFAQAVVHLIRDPQTRRGIEAAARRLVVEKYDWSTVAADFEAALVRLTKGNAAAA